MRAREVAESDLCDPRLPKRSDMLFTVLVILRLDCVCVESDVIGH